MISVLETISPCANEWNLTRLKKMLLTNCSLTNYTHTHTHTYIYIYIHIYIYIYIYMIYGPGNRGSILSRVMPKTQKMVLDASLLNTHHYKVWIKGKVVEPSPTPRGSSFWKGSLLVVRNFYRQLYFLLIYIYSHPQTDLFRSIRTHQCG